MSQRAFFVTDIGYGDAGKGTTVDYLVRQAASAAVIRFNGGPQAAHNVVATDGRHHTFAQFGSGSLVPGVETYLSRFMLINPLNMFPEAEHLIGLGVPDIWQRTSVDREAVLITPWHIAGNRLRENSRKLALHGSCGQGIGEARADDLARPDLTIRVADILQPGLREKLERQRQYKRLQLRSELGSNMSMHDWHSARLLDMTDVADMLVHQYRQWAELVTIVDRTYTQTLVDRHERLVFEGAQGVLLDEWHGFHPHTTWSTTTNAHATTLLSETTFGGDVTRLGVTRAYTTRHGAGPFVTRDDGLAGKLTEDHNAHGQWQGAFRVGHLDMIALRYALAVCGDVDEIAVTCLDRVRSLPSIKVCDRYAQPSAVDAETYFEIDGRMVSNIRLNPANDLAYQSRLTELLFECTPHYRTTIPTYGVSEHELIQGYLQTLKDHLGLPLTLVSFGPTAADKRALTA